MIYPETGWPRRIQRLHLPMLSREINTSLLPFMIRLQKESPSALVIDWPVINMLPEKHQAYAIQWFAMAIALVVFYIVLGVRGNNPEPVISKISESEK
jgi:surfeit locus 1 family protein